MLSIAEITVFSHHTLYKNRLLTWIYFLSGVLIGIIPLFRYEKPVLRVNTRPLANLNKIFLYAAYLFLFVLLYQFVYMIDSYRLNFRDADMLPSISILGKRWLSGKEVYTPLTEINRPEVLYGPGFWLPYLVPTLLKTDIRWTSFFFFILGIGFLWYQAGKEKLNWVVQAGLYLIILLACYFYFFDIWADLRLTQEPLIIAYYLLLGYILLQNKNKKHQWLWAGLMIGLCLLSRFSFLLWVPFYLIYLWKYEGIKKAVQVSSVVGIIVVLLFIVPFGIDGIKKFATLPSFQANQMAERFAQAPRDTELGMAKFFSSKDGWFIYNLQRGFSLLIMATGIITVLLSPKWIDKTWLPIAFLKIILVFFCNFLQIPYSYLFGPSTFLSLMILTGFVQQKIEWTSYSDPSGMNTAESIITKNKAVLMFLFALPVIMYAIIQKDYFNRRYLPYQKNSVTVYEQNFNNLAEEEHWIKTIPIDSSVAYSGKYSNMVGLNSPYGCTFKVPVKYLKDKKYTGVRFYAWVKSNESQIDVSRMVINVSDAEKIAFYRDKDISPELLKDNIWRRHVFAVEIPEKILRESNEGYFLSAFISYFDPSNCIYVDDISVELF